MVSYSSGPVVKKNYESIDPILSLKNELNNLANSAITEEIILDPCNSLNQYDNWGEAAYIGFLKITDAKSNYGSSLDPNDFKTRFLSEIPKEFQTIETKNIDLENIDILGREFLSLFVHRSVIESIHLSKKMEELLSNSNAISENDKEYLLKFVSLVRYYTYLSHTISIDSKGMMDRTFEQCWIDGLQAIEDGGLIQKLECVFGWPACFAVILADCALEQLTQ